MAARETRGHLAVQKRVSIFYYFSTLHHTPHFMPDKSSEDLKMRLLAHEKGAIRHLYHTVLPQISGYVRAKGGNITDAEDVFQEGMIALYENLQSPDFQLNNKLETYLYSICKYIWIKNLKKSGQKDGTFLTELAHIYGTASESNLYDRECQQLFNEKFELLSEECKVILRMFFEGYSMDDIQQKMGISTRLYARKKKFICKEKLVEMIQKDPIYIELRTNG